MNVVKSRQPVADHGEVFTPAWMVEAMLDLVKSEAKRIDSRFLAPACGSGHFLGRRAPVGALGAVGPDVAGSAPMTAEQISVTMALKKVLIERWV